MTFPALFLYFFWQAPAKSKMRNGNLNFKEFVVLIKIYSVWDS